MRAEWCNLFVGCSGAIHVGESCESHEQCSVSEKIAEDSRNLQKIHGKVIHVGSAELFTRLEGLSYP